MPWNGPAEDGGMQAIAAMCSHVPNKGEQMIRYYGYYSNVSRGNRKKNDQDELIPSILEPHGSFQFICGVQKSKRIST